MAITSKEELNIYKKPKQKSIPIEQYFEEMDLDETEKEERKKLANLFFDLFVFALALIKTEKAIGNSINVDYYTELISRHYRDAIQSTGIDVEEKYPYLWSYSQQIAKDIVQTSTDHLNDAYYTSNDRALFIAENEANSVRNYVNEEDAIQEGYTKKTWVTKFDKKVRHTHEQIHMKTIGIYQMFQVGNASMRYPKDIEASDYPEEIVNCRCTCKYSK